MRITVRFHDGAIEEFNTNALTIDSALGRTNALTDLRVILQNGLWVEASWYRVVCSEGTEMPLAQRSSGCRLHVLSEEEVGAGPLRRARRAPPVGARRARPLRRGEARRDGGSFLRH